MNRILVLIFLNNLLLSCSSQKLDTMLIAECFRSCQSAIVNMDGQNAIGHISTRTIAEYSDLLEKVKKLDSSQLIHEKFATKLFILKVRHTVSPKIILKLDGNQLLILAINKGISNNNNIGNCRINAITISDSSAAASLIIRNKESPFRYLFWKENNSWKMTLHTSTSLPYKALFQEATISENDYINSQLEKLSGTKPSKVIWQPVQPQK